MPTLKNTRHEAFAQELAKGKSADDAYVLAGFKPNRGNAARLKANEGVKKRVAELQSKAAEKAEITIESLIAEADELKEGAVRDKKWAAAVGALNLKAKLSGNLVEKGKFEHTGANGEPLPEPAQSVVIFQLPDNGRSQPG